MCIRISNYNRFLCPCIHAERIAVGKPLATDGSGSMSFQVHPSITCPPLRFGRRALGMTSSKNELVIDTDTQIF